MKKRNEKKRKSPPKIVSVMVVSLLMLAGFALVLYPTVADKINDSLNEQVITEYQKKVDTLGNEEYRKILDSAREYNETLAFYTPYISTLTAEKREAYLQQLDVTGTGLIGYIEVKKSDVYLGIYHGTSESVLQTGVGHLEGSSLPVTGKSVHTVLTGHSGLPSARLFTDLDKLKIGDGFTLHILNETLIYEVEDIRRVSPEDLKSLRIEQGRELCTLMTCTPYGINTHRLVITGHRIETPMEEKPDTALITQAVTSKWNRWFLFLPAVLFAGILATGMVVRKKKKKKQK